MLKTAIVTGSAGGIGMACARKLLNDGFRVLAFDLVSCEKAEELYQGVPAGLYYQQGDLTKDSDRRAALTKVIGWGGLGLLVNVAGVAPKVRNDLLEMTEESYDFVMNVNVKGTLMLTQLAAKQMLAQQGPKKGMMINISSMSAYTSSVSRGEYCISKAGVSMITRLFADRLAGEGIWVYEIRPGIIQTGMTAGVKEKYDTLIEGGLLPISRWGIPEDIAEAVSLFAEGRLPYSTGEVLNIDGGFHLRRL